MTNRVSEFRKELHALLVKYDACLDVDVQGDTHGLEYNFNATFGMSNPRFGDRESVTLVQYSTGVEANDLV
ncbi:hypothetical protein [Ralstonia phage RP13]|nr:hypothetical protein [Ralstonia phage RP13]